MIKFKLGETWKYERCDKYSGFVKNCVIFTVIDDTEHASKVKTKILYSNMGFTKAGAEIYWTHLLDDKERCKYYSLQSEVGVEIDVQGTLLDIYDKLEKILER